MIRLRLRQLIAACVLALCAAPALADAADLGGVSADGAALVAAPALVGQQAGFTGTLGPAGGAREVRIELLAASGAWVAVATATSAPDGSFSALWRPLAPGRTTARAVLVEHGALTAQASAPPQALTTVHRRSVATWYDQSGSTGACGVRLRKDTLGVAHRRLPCGTLVDVSYNGRSVTVPVVDRGPFRRGVSYDLTIAAARAIGMVAAGRAHVGVLASPDATPLLLVPELGIGGLPA